MPEPAQETGSGDANEVPPPAEPSTVPLRRVCVYCGSSTGKDPAYAQAAEALGREFARRGLDLVYGGGSVGLMGAVARTIHESEQHVLGVIPKALMPKEIAGEVIGDVIVVADMHERKATMAKKADGFIALPGGFGTLEELLEMITWSQIGIHSKPIGVLNIKGYYDPLLQFFDLAVERGFIPCDNRDSILTSSDPAELLDKMANFKSTYKAPISQESWEMGYDIAK